ncbi:type II 3-dehydroquinate dehydratase [Streptomyces sp. NRRL B-1347]|uniref:type II 3-dehydroquinate dehydratase n=1 Tax=Streptomyces sp. NRRL B-1347 TaxID=1476877 RepID=UPI0006913CE1|nr:type II 3-dehydroquinate dehydratase [Streptomyces sp. NRRL B-1347]
MSVVLLLNGPNLGVLGRREPEIYGTDTLADIEAAVADEVRARGWEVLSVQHDSEGDLVGAIHRHGESTVGAIVNPGALMIAGWSLRDALASYAPPWVEVHLSNVWAREQFRHESVIAPLASGVVVGLGAFGYRLAARALLHLTAAAPRSPRGSNGKVGGQTRP